MTQRTVKWFNAEKGYGLSPLPKSTLLKSGSTIPVKFRLTNTAGQPISPTTAAALATAGDVKATLTGPGISPQSALCTWNSTNLLFQCNIKTPTGLQTGTANPYQITAYENVGAGFVLAPPSAPRPHRTQKPSTSSRRRPWTPARPGTARCSCSCAPAGEPTTVNGITLRKCWSDPVRPSVFSRGRVLDHARYVPRSAHCGASWLLRAW